MGAGSFYLLLGLPPFIVSAVLRLLMKDRRGTGMVALFALGWSALTTFLANITGHDNAAEAVVSYVIMFGLGFAVAWVAGLAGAGAAGLSSRLFRR